MDENNTNAVSISGDDISNMIMDEQTAVLTKSPMWMRFNLIHNIINSATKKDQIVWDKVNDYLHNYKINDYDYEFNDHVKNIEEFEAQRNQCLQAPLLNLGWQTKICRECKKQFSIPYSEVKFFERKELKTPRRCSECRKKKEKI